MTFYFKKTIFFTLFSQQCIAQKAASSTGSMPIKTQNLVSESAIESTSPGVFEIVSGISSLQGSLTSLFENLADSLDGVKKEEPVDDGKNDAMRAAEKRIRDNTKRASRPEKMQIPEDEDDELFDNDEKIALRKRRLQDKKKPSVGPKVRAYATNWLSLFGWNTGITGLAKDFVFNYYKRDYFHNRNGPLINAVKNLTTVLVKRTDDDDLAHAIENLVKIGANTFYLEGALRDMFLDLKSFTTDTRVFDAFADDEAVGDKLMDMRKLLKFLVTDMKTQEKEVNATRMDVTGYDEL